ncbi:MAG: anhydro-N-acetylmuramic acid kinase [Bacteroidales bacterium]|jgi:anhydro-N-acetylmuramic acid kinase|nr:anhydro-N-acetylmuramic acid kinase [Bacteroidales bacterium]MDD4176137.1 anhydro-N-acetylmuramic acid kinase [Bacteroidales bacterium]MDD4740576.1 anhydro-N-acetylmuramic acid kinase [Bacteroidales bacterium]
MEQITALGMMSGTSLDGLDIACCRFGLAEARWDYEILCAETIHYSDHWRRRLDRAPQLNGFDLTALDADFGRYAGEEAAAFIRRNNCRPLFVASHGHTVFHQPEQGLTLQIGHGAHLAAAAGIRVINDFRSLDVALGGQGAPLVPAGDALLFEQYGLCLNLGGFANISYQLGDHRLASDISPANMALNFLARRAGKLYDKDGAMAAGGAIIHPLLDRLDALPFYQQPAPKSLGREWFESQMLPLIEAHHAAPADLLCTLTEHIARQVAAVADVVPSSTLLATGGGTHNHFLIQRIGHHTRHEVIIPEPLLIDYKEALVFAFLGVLRLRGKNNCLASVTGARTDNSGGSIWG